MNILFGILGIAASFLAIRFRKQVIGFTGQWPFAEKIFGMGHTDLALLLVAIFIFFLSIALMTGNLDNILGQNVGELMLEPTPRAKVR